MAKKKETKTAVVVSYPIAKAGKYICSDGTEYSQAYHAKKHEIVLTKNKDNGTIR